MLKSKLLASCNLQVNYELFAILVVVFIFILTFVLIMIFHTDIYIHLDSSQHVVK